MKVLELLAIGNLDGKVLLDLAPALTNALHLPCEIIPGRMDPAFAFHRERQQYHSSEILHAMQDIVSAGTWRVLGVAGVDLYIPILTFVFGEAQMGGPCAVVSSHRLRQHFYGLPEDEDLLRNRLRKEALHEVGHTLDLTHCDDYQCAMSPSHAVEWIDLKEDMLCAGCQKRALLGASV
jgi:archaemetzincin